jgi:inorganic pyrophosphatase
MGFVYEINYGYVPNTLAPDGAELDAYFLGVDKPLEEATGVCIAIVHRLDDDDDKLVVVPEGVELSDEAILEAVHFQEQFFNSVIVRA